MTTPSDTTWKIEPHTQAKHEILRRYLGGWFPILDLEMAELYILMVFVALGVIPMES